MLGERVTLFCMNYIYTGLLAGVNDNSVMLVYETGPFDSKQWQDAQPLPHSLFVMTSAIEAVGVVK